MQTLKKCRAVVAWVAVATAVFSFSASAQDRSTKLEAGQYEQLLLAIDLDGRLTGYYHEEQGLGVVKDCSFFISGKTTPNTGEAKIETWSSSVFPGRLEAYKNAVQLQIPRAQEHDGCALVLLPEIASGVGYTKIKSAPWLEIRTVSVPRAHFHSLADADHALKSFVVKDDVVAVVARQGAWLQVDFVGETKTTRGWLEAASTDQIQRP